MWWFALIVAGLIAATLALLLRPLLRAAPPRDPVTRDELNVEIYRERLAELEADHANRLVSTQELEQAKLELQRELLQDVPARREAAEPAPTSTPSWRAALVIGASVPALAIGLYLGLGTWTALDSQPIADAEPTAEQMVAGLAARLRNEPEDPQGWLLLARSYAVLERYPEAVDAFAQAHARLGDQVDLLVDYAEAQAMAAESRLVGAPAARIELALALQPDHHKGLWLAGFAALQSGEPVRAVARWQALLALQPPQSEQARVIGELIARTAGANDPVAQTTGPAVRVTVSLDAAVAAGLDGSESVFIYARALDGPPMPVAAARRRVSELPLTITLDDGASMAPGVKLSAFSRVMIGARVSRSGRVAASPGDLQGLAGPIEVTPDASASITIDEVVE